MLFVVYGSVDVMHAVPLSAAASMSAWFTRTMASVGRSGMMPAVPDGPTKWTESPSLIVSADGVNVPLGKTVMVWVDGTTTRLEPGIGDRPSATREPARSERRRPLNLSPPPTSAGVKTPSSLTLSDIGVGAHAVNNRTTEATTGAMPA